MSEHSKFTTDGLGGIGEPHHDATIPTEEKILQTLVHAAQNIRLLSKASFTANPLSIQVIVNLPLYSQLTNLSITRVKPEEHIWNVAPSSLKKLKWDILATWYPIRHNPWDTAMFLIQVAEVTSPDLQSLDISFPTHGLSSHNCPCHFNRYHKPVQTEAIFLSTETHTPLAFQFPIPPRFRRSANCTRSRLS
jgi:hypothetical protein